jgi:DHA3 family macrolide efflux protein-like MFS transporter
MMLNDWKARFFTIWVGQQISLFGSQIAQFGLVWWLTKETGSATVLATAALVAMLPQVVFGPFAGAWVDRLPRRWLMIWVDFGVALLAGLLGYLFWAGAIRVWHIYLVMALRGIGGAVHWPAMAAATSLLAPKEHLARVAGLNQTVNGVFSIASPSLGALAVSILPMYEVMGIDVFTFIFAILPLLYLVIPEPKRSLETKTSYIMDLKAGLRYVLTWRGLTLVLCFSALLTFIAQPMFTLLPLLIKEWFGRGALELGWMESAWGIGVSLGGLFLSAWGGFRKNIYTAILGIFGVGLGWGVLGLLPQDAFHAALGVFFFAGFMNPLANAPFMSLLQSTVNPQIQGRVFSLMNSISQGMSPLALLIAGPLADLFGVRLWYLVGGIGAIIVAALGVSIPDIRQLEKSRPEERTPRGPGE